MGRKGFAVQSTAREQRETVLAHTHLLAHALHNTLERNAPFGRAPQRAVLGGCHVFMKITLDTDELLSEGRISPDEYSRLKQLAAETTASFALNLALAFGIVAVAGGTLALFQSASADIFLG